jgi:hypothetical protein
MGVFHKRDLEPGYHDRDTILVLRRDGRIADCLMFVRFFTDAKDKVAKPQMD